MRTLLQWLEQLARRIIFALGLQRIGWNFIKYLRRIDTYRKSIGVGPIVRVRQGVLQGWCFETERGVRINCFHGVPYARPPLGKLRFQAPQPAEPWTGIRDAAKEGNECAQYDNLLDMLKGKEDCLYMNIYAPTYTAKKLLPVMVWVHGGGFCMHSGTSDIFGPDLLVEQDVVLVTFNYRLGPLGFMSLDTAKMPGNAGLKDQVAALRWVRDNIDAFHGDAGNVTLFGESAGAASVHYLLVSDSTKGLFHKAISQSGSALNPWALQKNPRQRALAMCFALGHPTDDLDDAFEFLQSVPAMDLVKGQDLILTPGDKRRRLGLIMVPTIEKEFIGVEPFITEPVLEKITKGEFHNVPYIAGYNSSEGTLFVNMFRDNHLCVDLERDFERMIPNFVDIEIGTPDSKKLAEIVRKYYFSDDPITESSVKEYARITGDTEFVYGVYKTVQIQASLSSSPTWMYRFSYDGFSLLKLVLGTDVPGVGHADDLVYLFKVNILPVSLPNDSAFQTTTKRFIKMWTDFAKTSDPTPEWDESIPIRWEPVTNDDFRFLEFGEELSMNSYHDEQIAFWEDLVVSIHKRYPTRHLKI